MHKWFECKIKYEKNASDGKITNANESYLVDALSHAEAENRIIEEMKPFISGEFTVDSVRRMRISEMFPNESGDKWYRCKVFYISLDEEKGIEKKVGVTMMVQASTVKEAWSNLQEGMKDSMADYEVASITETKILDIYHYEVSDNESEPEKA